MSLRLAIFDMDGTLVDSRDVIQNAMTLAFENSGLVPPPYEETRKIVGLGLDVAIETLAPDHDDLPGLVQAYRHAFVSLRTQPDFHEPLYDGTLETLDRLANDNWLIAMATGKSHSGIRALFEKHPLEPYFDTVWCADDGPGKPHPFMVEEAMKAVGAEPHQSLIIGDAIHDIAMGRAAGIHTMGVSWGFGRHDELKAAGAHEIHHEFGTLQGSLEAFSERLLT